MFVSDARLKKSKEIKSQVLKRYFDEIGKEELLSPEEEIELARRVKEGDNDALNRLLKANLRFVVTVAKKYQNQGLTLEDLINEGNIGLIKAARKFDETRGFKFISYAVWWIRQTILQAISEQSRTVRLPLNVIGNINRVSQITSEFEQEFEREPTHEEIENIVKEENIDIDAARQFSEGTVSMETPVGPNKETTIGDFIPSQDGVEPDHSLMEISFKQEVKKALESLEPREAAIIKLYFGIDRETPLTLEEIGERLNLTRERVRQIKERAIRKLRHSSRALILKGYLG
ncbi:MAG: sigma-70 family RNA polymerase sigma factor [Candidatus Marinimicrobia bacterium]|nr:sigma-70 family RNA polymerase sigma factor [Candidatus Neomarinimicrobiota bacterium]